jgi:hypothetical protein
LGSVTLGTATFNSATMNSTTMNTTTMNSATIDSRKNWIQRTMDPAMMVSRYNELRNIGPRNNSPQNN